MRPDALGDLRDATAEPASAPVLDNGGHAALAFASTAIATRTRADVAHPAPPCLACRGFGFIAPAQTVRDRDGFVSVAANGIVACGECRGARIVHPADVVPLAFVASVADAAAVVALAAWQPTASDFVGAVHPLQLTAGLAPREVTRAE